MSEPSTRREHGRLGVAVTAESFDGGAERRAQPVTWTAEERATMNGWNRLTAFGPSRVRAWIKDQSDLRALNALKVAWPDWNIVRRGPLEWAAVRVEPIDEKTAPRGMSNIVSGLSAAAIDRAMRVQKWTADEAVGMPDA